MKRLLAILLLLPLVAFGQVEVRRYATMTELLSANPTAFAVAGRATVVVTGRTNFYDGWSRVLSYSSSDTNAADNTTIFSPSNTNFPGRYRLLYLESATNSSVRAGVIPPYGYNSLWINGAWVPVSNLFVAGTNMQLTVTSNQVSFAMTNLTGGGSGTPLIATVDGLTFTNLDLVSQGDLYWNVPDFTNLYARLYPNAVDYSEFQQVSGQRLLGNPSGSGANVSEISIGANLSLSGGGVLSALVPAGTNSFQISVDGTIVNTPNLSDSSEIDSSASGTNITFSLLSSSVALAKLESINASRLVGRGSSGSGSPEQITLGSGLSMSGTTINPAVSSFSANGTAISAPNILNAAEISASISALTNVYMSLNAGSVGFSKLQDVSSGVLVGRGASGTGVLSQITLGSGLALTTNGVLSATGTNTTLVRVGGTAVTGPNFLDSTEMDWYIDLSTNVSIDLFPSSVVFSKLQNISTSRLLGRSTSGSGAIEQIQIGTGLSLSSGTLSATGGGGTNGTAVFVDGVSISNPNFTDAATTGLFDVSGSNITIRLPDRDFGSVTVSGSGASITLDNGSISSNNIAAGQVSQDKLGTSGTATSTNFLAGDYSWKQVTTNMIPGLNAVLATIGTGGSGGGTNIKVNGTLVNNANLIDSSSVLVGVSGSDISFTVTNVAGSTTSNVLQRTGSGIFKTTVNNISNSATNGVVEAITHNSGSGSGGDTMIVSVTLTARSDTNYLVGVEIEDSNTLSASEPATWNVGEKTTTGFKLHSTAPGTGAQPNGYWYRFWILEPVAVGGSGGGGSGTVTSVAASTGVSGLAFTGTPITTSGTLSLTGVVGVASGGTGATNAADARTNLGVLSSRWTVGTGTPTNYSGGTGSYYVDINTYQVWEQTDESTWATIPFFVMGEGVYSYLTQNNTFTATNIFNSQVRFNSTVSNTASLFIGTTNVAVELANKQPLDSDLTSLAAGTAMATAITNASSVGAPLLIAGTTNVAVELSNKQPLDSDLTSLAAGTAMATAITNAASVGAPTLIVGTTNVAVAIAAKAPLASPAFTTQATIGGTNVLDYAATHLTEAEASALYQRTNANLTTVANLTGGTSTNFLAGDGAFKQVTTNMVSGLNAILATIGGGSGEANTASNLGTPSATVQGLYDSKSGVELRFRSIEAGSGITLTSNATTLAIASTGGTWDGTPIASGTITNLTVSKINQSTYYDVENGDSWAEGTYTTSTTTFHPYVAGLLNSGTVGNDWPTTNNIGVWSIKSSSSSDSGAQFITSANAIVLNGNGHEHTTICTINQTNAVMAYFGFQDNIFSTSLPTDGVFLLLASGHISGAAINNGTATYTVTSNTITPSDTDRYRMVSTVGTDGIATFQAQKILGVNNYTNVWSGSVTSTIVPWPTGFGVTAFRTTGSNNLTLITVDALGQRNLRKYAR